MDALADDQSLRHHGHCGRNGRALDRAGGDVGLIDWAPDPAIEAIVETWPARFETARSDAMGFARDENIDAILKAYREDDM